jgi:uncharacterized YccA/Bax inhibitor family protein
MSKSLGGLCLLLLAVFSLPHAASGPALLHAQAVVERVMLGAVEEVTTKAITVADARERQTFAITSGTKMPARVLVAGDKTRVFYVAADTKVATKIEFIE